MMLKKNLNETRQEHPLFVRGFDKTKLSMEVVHHICTLILVVVVVLEWFGGGGWWS